MEKLLDALSNTNTGPVQFGLDVQYIRQGHMGLLYNSRGAFCARNVDELYRTHA